MVTENIGTGKLLYGNGYLASSIFNCGKTLWYKYIWFFTMIYFFHMPLSLYIHACLETLCSKSEKKSVFVKVRFFSSCWTLIDFIGTLNGI